MTIIGYARVSTDAQDLEIQLQLLTEAGCTKLFTEKESGIDDEREQLNRLLKTLRQGDVVIVVALDRLTRGGPYKTLAVLHQIAMRGASYRSLAEPWTDPVTDIGELLAAFVGYIGRKTREDILRRTSAGRARAKARGVKFGRKPKLSVEQRREALQRRRAGEDLNVIARSFQVSASTISRLREIS